jgi:5-methylcytosine-specific restriction endonuclease McrBC GTP-binding regulatory subunit McrB
MKIIKIVTHHENPARAADLFYQEGVVAVGWTEFGDITNLTKEQIMEISQKKWRRTETESLTDAVQLIRFRDEIQKGDIIIAYRKNNIVAMIGEVVGDYYFDDKNVVGDPDGEVGYANQRKVKWWKEPRNFDRSHLPAPLNEKVALPGTILTIAGNYDKNKLIEHLKKEGLNVSFQDGPHGNWWIEKTYVKGRPTRETGDYALGKALWSPQKDKGGADSYRNMRDIKKGDVVLHFVDNESIVGVSVVEQEYNDKFTCLPGTEWDDGTGKRPGYLVRLKGYKQLDSPIRKDEILNAKNKNLLFSILEKYKNVFYNRSLELRQGAYITEVPAELVALINDIYHAKTGKNLPYFDSVSTGPGPLETLHMLYKIAWHPGGYKGGFCGNAQEDACEAFGYIKKNKAMQPCSKTVYHCVDEHEAFADFGWKVTIHPPQTKRLHELSEGRSLIFLVAPTNKYKSKYRLVGFYTLKTKIIENGKVKILEAEKTSSSKFDLQNRELELDNDELKKLFNVKKWTPRTTYEFITCDTAIEVLNYVYEKHKGKEIGDPDVNLDAMKRAIELLQHKAPQDRKITIFNYLSSQGFNFEESSVSAFYTALKTKGFVILAGLTGTGKTKLPQLFCDLVADKNQKLFVPVRPDWRDSKPLVGYFNPIEGKYETTELLNLILMANDNWEKGQSKDPFFVLLDEMNLARVEYYFADFLSVLESGRDENSHFLTKEAILLHTSKQCKTRDGNNIPPKIKLPPNLYFVGTVNLDETTYSFSPKVLDRAFVIEFWQVDLERYPGTPKQEADDKLKQELKSAVLEDLSRGGKFLSYTKEDVESAFKLMDKLYDDLKELHKILQEFGLHFGYRVVNEIALFYQNAIESMDKGIVNFSSNEQILDYAISMKILPKIHGNRGKVEDPLNRMLAWTIEPEKWKETIEEIQENGRMKNEYLQVLGKTPMDFLSKVAGSRKIKYRHTAEKIARMLYQLCSTGFTSYL